MPRPEGTPNKNKAYLLKRLQDQYGDNFHPIMRMASNADRLQKLLETIPDSDIDVLFVGLKNSIDAWDKIAQYTEPKLKAVEISGSVETRTKVVIKDLSGKKPE